MMGISSIGIAAYRRQSGAIDAPRRIAALNEKDLTTSKTDVREKRSNPPERMRTVPDKPTGRGEPGKLLDVYA